MDKKVKSSLIVIVAVAVSLFVCKDRIWKGNQQKKTVVSKERVAKLYKITQNGSISTANYPGVVKSLKHAELFFRVSGPVVERNLKVGQLVKKGDVLMKLDQRDYQREIDKISQDVRMNKEQRDLNKIQFERNKKLYEEQAISKAEYDTVLTKYQISEAQVQSLEESLKKANDKLADTYLKAPFDGLVTNLKIEQFEIAQANVPVMSIDDLKEVEIHISVPSGNVPDMKFGDGQKLKNKEFDVRFPGRNNRILKAVIYEFKAVATDNSESYDVALKLKAPDDFVVLPGMSAEVINVPNYKAMKDKPITVPFASVFKRGESSYVWVFNPSTRGISARQVMIGEPISTNDIAILSGLNDNEYIIAAGVDWLTEENTIRVMNPEVLNANR